MRSLDRSDGSLCAAHASSHVHEHAERRGRRQNTPWLAEGTGLNEKKNERVSACLVRAQANCRNFARSSFEKFSRTFQNICTDADLSVTFFEYFCATKPSTTRCVRRRISRIVWRASEQAVAYGVRLEHIDVQMRLSAHPAPQTQQSSVHGWLRSTRQ
jgi:hypothetical protein